MDKLCSLIASPKGFWCLLAFLSLASSLMAQLTYSNGTMDPHAPYTKEPTSENQLANVTDCLAAAALLMKEADDSLHKFQERFNCTMEQIQPDNPNNEEKIKKACMGQKSSEPEFCMSGEHYDPNQDLCMDTIYTILNKYEVKIKTFNSPELLNAVNHLMRKLKSDPKITEQQTFKPPPRKKSYGNDLNQCEILLILQQLSQTIHRNLNFLKSIEI